MTLILSGTDSSVSAPAVQGGTGGTTTGVYYPATNQLALATNGTQAVLVDSSQNVGIGTASPGYKLDVAGASGVRIAEVAAQNGFELAAGSTVITTAYNRTTNTWLALRQRALQHEFYTNGTETMRIDSSGNVGIGTTSPDLKLSVAGGMNLRNSSRAGAFEIDSSGNLWAGTATTAGNIYLETGHTTSGLPSTGTARVTVNQYGLGLGATPSSGTGITFPATQSASSDANTLDDYEEGTFTPVLSASGYTFSLSSQYGLYTKIGNCVNIKIYFVSAYSTGSGTTGGSITGLPFSTSNNAANYGGCSMFPDSGSAFFSRVGCIRTNQGASSMYIGNGWNGSGMSANLNWAVSGTIEWEISGQYFTS